MPLPLSWQGTSSWLHFQTSRTWSSFHSHSLGHVHLTKPFKCPASHLPHTWAYLAHCPSNSIIPQQSCWGSGYSPSCADLSLFSLELTWPSPFQAMPYLLRKDPPRKSFWFIHRNWHKLLSFQHSSTTTFKFLYLFPQTSYSWGKLFHLKQTK